jgi:hypothetical protein
LHPQALHAMQARAENMCHAAHGSCLRVSTHKSDASLCTCDFELQSQWILLAVCTITRRPCSYSNTNACSSSVGGGKSGGQECHVVKTQALSTSHRAHLAVVHAEVLWKVGAVHSCIGYTQIGQYLPHLCAPAVARVPSCTCTVLGCWQGMQDSMTVGRCRSHVRALAMRNNEAVALRRPKQARHC